MPQTIGCGLYLRDTLPPSACPECIILLGLENTPVNKEMSFCDAWRHFLSFPYQLVAWLESQAWELSLASVGTQGLECTHLIFWTSLLRMAESDCKLRSTPFSSPKNLIFLQLFYFSFQNIMQF